MFAHIYIYMYMCVFILPIIWKELKSCFKKELP